jgi:hypothetical protein
MLDPPVFDPVVLELPSVTIWVTSLLSGSINTILSGSLTKRRFFVSGTCSVTLFGIACGDMESGTCLPTCACSPDGVGVKARLRAPD